MKKKLLIFGSGDLGIEVLDLIHNLNKKQNQWDVVGFVSNSKKKKINNIKVYNSKEIPSNLNKNIFAICAIMDAKIKESVIKNEINNRLKLITLIHPSSNISQTTKIGRGSIVMSNCAISYNVKIGNNVIISSNCAIGHMSNIGDNTLLSPGCLINGNTSIEKNCIIGSGVITHPRVKRGSNCIIGLGTTIFKNLQKNTSLINQQRLIKLKRNSKKTFQKK